MIKILMIDKQEEIKSHKQMFFEKGFEVMCAENAFEGIKLASEIQPQIILLEIELEGMDGIAACAEIRKIPKLKNSFLMVLTDLTDEYIQIAALNAGADDYIFKSLSPRVLLRKIFAIINRIDPKSLIKGNLISLGEYIIDRERYLLLKGNEEISLPRKEFELLFLLSDNPTKVFSREEIFSSVWGFDFDPKNRTVDVHIRNLRKKIGRKYIGTLKGKGYFLKNI
jgi:two-component system, OmpR family, alkaline phosphatase synthesis response regulator PhoP